MIEIHVSISISFILIANMPGKPRALRVNETTVAVVADTWWRAKTALDALPIEGIVGVARPEPVHATRDAEVDARATGGAALDRYLRMPRAQLVEEIASPGLARGHRRRAITTP